MEELKGMDKAGKTFGSAPSEDRKAFRILMGPVIGLLYVVLMPFLAIVTVVALLGGKALGVLFGMAGKSVSFGWRPEASYLSGKGKEKEKGGEDK
jgi:hypothetical protein